MISLALLLTLACGSFSAPREVPVVLSDLAVETDGRAFTAGFRLRGDDGAPLVAGGRAYLDVLEPDGSGWRARCRARLMVTERDFAEATPGGPSAHIAGRFDGPCAAPLGLGPSTTQLTFDSRFGRSLAGRVEVPVPGEGEPTPPPPRQPVDALERRATDVIRAEIAQVVRVGQQVPDPARVPDRPCDDARFTPSEAFTRPVDHRLLQELAGVQPPPEWDGGPYEGARWFDWVNGASFVRFARYHRGLPINVRQLLDESAGASRYLLVYRDARRVMPQVRGVLDGRVDFAPGLFEGLVAVSDRQTGEALCWAHFIARSSAEVRVRPGEPASEAVDADFRRRFGDAAREAVGRMSKVLRPR